MNKKDMLKSITGSKSFDISSMADLNKKLQNLRDNPKEDVLDQLLELKSSINMLIGIMPNMKAMLNPYIIKLDKGIEEFTKKRNDEKQ